MNNTTAIRLFPRELPRRLDFPRVILEPDTDAGRAASFAALEAADRSTADHAQILVVQADPEPGDALPAPRGERAESITHPHRPVIAYFLEVQRRFPRIALQFRAPRGAAPLKRYLRRPRAWR